MLVCVFLQPHKDLSNVRFDDNLLDVLTGFFVFHEGMVEDVLPSHALVLVDHQGSLQEVLRVLSDLGVVGETKRLIADSVEVLVQTSAGPGRVAENHLVEHEAQAPNIRLGRVRLILQQLRSHVDRRSADVSKLLPSEYVSLAGKAEVGDLVVTVLNKRVGRFDITMDVTLMNQDAEALNDLLEGMHAISLSESPRRQFLSKISIANLQNHISETVLDLGIEHPHSVIRVNIHRDCNFSL